MSVQAKLKEQGYYEGQVDGIWGPRSTSALKKYQQEKDIQATGELNQQTADELGLSQSEFAAFESAVEQQRSQQQQSEQQPGARQQEQSGGQ